LLHRFFLVARWRCGCRCMPLAMLTYADVCSRMLTYAHVC
jgi:hypothetical protein